VGAPPAAAPAYGARAAVARAAVRPVSPAVGAPGDPGDPDGAGHNQRGSASKILTKASKRRRRMNILTAAAAVLVILVGAGVVGGTYFFDSVKFDEPTADAQATQLLASDNKTVIASLGENRSIVPDQSINPLIKLAVVAAEDGAFYKHNGIDMKGIARAAWNNFTGGETQGASTITQQYAKYATKRKEITYNVKLREAVIARKMEDEYSKDQILGRYLNSVYFGRRAYGIEAAVKAYFGPSRSALTPIGKKGAITAGEAAILASVIKQPEAEAGGHPGYDPQLSPTEAQSRWRYTVGNMAKLALPAGMPEAGVPPGINPPTEYPTTYNKKWDPEKCTTTCGNDKPSGRIVKYVMRELRDMKITPAQINQGGLQIRTTINKDVQAEAEKAANGLKKSSPLYDINKKDKTYKSALVAINPENGRVIAYYGGPDASSWDYAGPNYRDDGSFLGGGRPPGSTFKIYTLLAALNAGYGMDTIWDSTKKKVNNGGKISNAGREGGGLQCPSPKACSLKISTEQSYNFTFYWLADQLGPEKVIDMAHKAGIQLIGDPETAARWDLNKLSPEEIEKKGYGREVGFGQYAITALDHASGVATIANNGVYNKAHFIQQVRQRDPKTGKFVAVKGMGEKLRPVEAFSPDVAAAAQNVMQRIPGINSISLANGRKAIGKTGTWEFTGEDGKPGDNGDAWMVGGTKAIAAAVWVGRERVNKKTDKTELMPIYKFGREPMNGGSTPGKIWKMFLDEASKAINADNKDFLPNSTTFVDPSKKGNGEEPPPKVETPLDPSCVLFQQNCDENGNGNNGNGENGNNGNGNGENGNNGNGNGENGNNGQPGNTLPTFPDGNADDDTDDGN
jgi:membrane peptidoglycan carboxypeptidase